MRCFGEGSSDVVERRGIDRPFWRAPPYLSTDGINPKGVNPKGSISRGSNPRGVNPKGVNPLGCGVYRSSVG